jgi:hypothetical protein
LSGDFTIARREMCKAFRLSVMMDKPLHLPGMVRVVQCANQLILTEMGGYAQFSTPGQMAWVEWASWDLEAQAIPEGVQTLYFLPNRVWIWTAKTVSDLRASDYQI